MKRLMMMAAVSFGVFGAITGNCDTPTAEKQETGFYSYTVKAIDGTDFPLSQLKGKKVLVVNVASRCGLTPQYKELQAVYDKYQEKDFTILAFPANNFGSQEPGSNEEIKLFCTSKYNVTFPMMEKISVKGDDQAPIYQWLTQKKLNGVSDATVSWNFQKFLINADGTWGAVIDPKVKPDAPEIIRWIEGTAP